MMTEEEYVRVETLRRAGWTIGQIADELGYHPATVSKWLREGPPPSRRRPVAVPVIDDRWAGRVAELLDHNEDLSEEWTHLEGSYGYPNSPTADRRSRVGS